MQKYLEAHITIESDGMSYTAFKDWCDKMNWKASMFEEDDVDDIAGKFFASFRSEDASLIQQEVGYVVRWAQDIGYEVLRWKLEQTLFDSNLGDKLEELEV